MVWATRLWARRSSGSRAFCSWVWLRKRSDRALSVIVSSVGRADLPVELLASRRLSRSASRVCSRTASAWTTFDGVSFSTVSPCAAAARYATFLNVRSEERRVGKVGGSPCSYRCAPFHTKKQNQYIY